MEVFDTTSIDLRNIWEDNVKRQNAKIVLFKAICGASEMTAREADNLFAELDRLLLKETTDTAPRLDPAR